MPFGRRVPYAHGRRRHKTGEINKTEAAYMAHLDLLIRLGEIQWRSEHEGVTVKLAKDLRYTADFAVLAADSILEFHDIKKRIKAKDKDGHHTGEFKPLIEDDALVKLKMVAQIWPVRVFTVIDANGNWVLHQVGGSDESEAAG
jgi:hypothetical protein